MRIVIATAALAGAAIATAAVALTPHRAHAQTLDRYGGTSAAPVPVQYSPAPAASTLSYAPLPAAEAGLRTLTWPGKTEQRQAARQPYAAPPRQASPSAAYSPMRFAPPPMQQASAAAYPAPTYAPAAPMRSDAPNLGATLPWSGGVQARPAMQRDVAAPAILQRSAFADAAPTPRPSPPTSIYSDAPQARPAQMTSGQGGDLTPAQRAALLPPPSNTSPSRLYSLHREYGMTPDAAPIPPAFFTAAADLTTPETPDAAPRNSPTASKAAQTAARLAAAAGQ